MKKEEVIKRYGEMAYKKMLEQTSAWRKAHREEAKAAAKKYREKYPERKKAANKKYKEEHPKVVEAVRRERDRKGGKYYAKKLEDDKTGLRGERNRIRMKHGYLWRTYKQIIAPDSQIHHEWIGKTAEYRGVALVEAKPHQYGIIDVIQILDGKITLLTEKEVREGKK